MAMTQFEEEMKALEAEPEVKTLEGNLATEGIPVDDIHIDDLLKVCVESGASDLHVSNRVPIIRIRGDLVPTGHRPLTENQVKTMIYQILTDEQIRVYEETFELDFSYTIANLCRFRVNVYRQKGVLAAAFRTIPTKIPTIEELSLPPILYELSRLPRGLILVTGPTGSGKSTTLAAIIGQINKESSRKIITMEDPIEYLHSDVNSIIDQREVGGDTYSFPISLREALRQDPDVILVGEMRDQETMAMAITTAETGHLVFSTIHTTSAASTIDRIVDVFPPAQQEQIRIQLAGNLEAVITQTLLPTKDGKGRIAATEIMRATPAIRNLIREKKAQQIPSTLQTSKDEGMHTLDKCLAELVLLGKVDYDVALGRAMNADDFKKMAGDPIGQGYGPTGQPGQPGQRPATLQNQRPNGKR